MKFKVETNYPVALESPDHLFPHGTKQDNSTNNKFIEEIIEYFGYKKINVMDLGCSGGQLVIDFRKRGCNAIGLEGSDYSAKHKRANWKKYYNKNLYTCDISKPFQVLLDNKPYECDCITAWEVIEHLTLDGLHTMFNNVLKHLKNDGLFVGSISMKHEIFGEYILHQTVMRKKTWFKFIESYFEAKPYIFENAVRSDEDSFHILLKKGAKK